MNAPSSPAEAASRASVVEFPQPDCAVRVTAYTSSIRLEVTVIAPETSKCRCATPARLSRSRNGVTASTAMPTGMLRKKTHDHEK